MDKHISQKERPYQNRTDEIIEPLFVKQEGEQEGKGEGEQQQREQFKAPPPKSHDGSGNRRERNAQQFEPRADTSKERTVAQSEHIAPRLTRKIPQIKFDGK